MTKDAPVTMHLDTVESVGEIRVEAGRPLVLSFIPVVVEMCWPVQSGAIGPKTLVELKSFEIPTSTRSGVAVKPVASCTLRQLSAAEIQVLAKERSDIDSSIFCSTRLADLLCFNSGDLVSRR